MSFSDTISADRRLAIMHLLSRAPGATANHGIIHAGLDEIGHRCSRDAVRTELSWLAEQGMVSVEIVAAGGTAIMVATLTERGEDVRAGRVTVPGVKRPTPRG